MCARCACPIAIYIPSELLLCVLAGWDVPWEPSLGGSGPTAGTGPTGAAATRGAPPSATPVTSLQGKDTVVDVLSKEAGEQEMLVCTLALYLHRDG